MLKRIFLLTWVAISLFLGWFAFANYRASLSIAEQNLNGLAHALTAAIEGMAVRHASLNALSEFHPTEIAFFALIDADGRYVFHTNPDLVGTRCEDDRYRGVLQSGAPLEGRVTLGTGEKAYEFFTPFYRPGQTLILHLALHTFRADAVVRRAEYNVGVILLLLVVGWLLIVVLYRASLREERIRLEMERRERLAQLGEMGAMLAHEIRNPLAGIKGYAQVIEKKPQEPRNAGFAQGIVKEAMRLEALVTDLLSYTRRESSPPSPVPLDELVGWAVALVRPETDRQQVELSIADGPSSTVMGNRDQLGQVLLNLLKNALQAMPDGGTLGVRVAGSGDTVTISVVDSGEGIAAEQLPRVFEPFFTTKARGTGLGLALCKKIVEEHGGKIALQSAPGLGTTVTVALPRKKTGGRRT